MYKLNNLSYLYQDLEPFIDTKTMALHYQKHAKNYLKQLNLLLVKNNYDFKYNINELIFHIDDFSIEKENILFNLGGVLNHNLLWKCMNSRNEKPSGLLKMYIDKKYGNFENFWNEFKISALKLKGSGYTFLVLKDNNDLEIINTPNQYTPLIDYFIPLFTIDLWEHAYYLNYQNEKERYIDNFKQIADFQYASKLYEKLVK